MILLDLRIKGINLGSLDKTSIHGITTSSGVKPPCENATSWKLSRFLGIKHVPKVGYSVTTYKDYQVHPYLENHISTVLFYCLIKIQLNLMILSLHDQL